MVLAKGGKRKNDFNPRDGCKGGSMPLSVCKSKLENIFFPCTNVVLFYESSYTLPMTFEKLLLWVYSRFEVPKNPEK